MPCFAERAVSRPLRGLPLRLCYAQTALPGLVYCYHQPLTLTPPQVARWLQPTAEILLRSRNYPAYDFAGIIELATVESPRMHKNMFQRALVSRSLSTLSQVTNH